MTQTMKTIRNRPFILVLFVVGVLLSCQQETPAPPVNLGECQWTLLDEPDPAVGVRAPVQFDTHAAYAFYLFMLSQSDGRTALKLEGDFPFAAYFGFTIYDGSTGVLEAALVDHEIVPEEGSQNPFLPGVEVNTPKRSYTVVVRPHGANPADHPEFVNQVEMPDTDRKPTGAARPGSVAADLWPQSRKGQAGRRSATEDHGFQLGHVRPRYVSTNKG